MARQYQEKLDNRLTEVMDAWWLGLSKEELLEFMADLEDVTADSLRGILTEVDCTIAFRQAYSLTAKASTASFNVGGETVGKTLLSN